MSAPETVPDGAEEGGAEGSDGLPSSAPDELILHATTVAVSGRAVLITGQSGSGKSALGLELMCRGARLVADDRTVLRLEPIGLMASAPAPLSGLIEARFVGLLCADPMIEAPVALAVDLDRTETERLPQRRTVAYLGQDVALLHKSDAAHFPAAIVQYLSGGRRY